MAQVPLNRTPESSSLLGPVNTTRMPGRTTLRHTLFCMLFLLPGLFGPVQAEVDTIGGHAHVHRLYADGWDGVRFDVMTPFFPLQDTLISITLTVSFRDGQMPENIVCSLRRDFKHVPADLHSVPGSQGGLGLMFERLDGFTKLQYIIAWKNKPGHRTYPHKATIHAAGSEWERTQERKFGSFYRETDGTPVEIVVDGPEECRLL
jgi:hypothetical protein